MDVRGTRALGLAWIVLAAWDVVRAVSGGTGTAWVAVAFLPALAAVLHLLRPRSAEARP